MLNNQNLRGTGKVYRFTLSQLMKGKANLISLILLVVIAFSVPLFTQLRSGFAASETSGLTAGQQQIVDSTIPVFTSDISEWDQSADTISEDDAYFLQYGYAMLLMMIAIMTSSYIMRSVVDEKSSKLVEYLMVSVRPLALLTGKILACLSYTVLILCLSAGAFGLSSAIFGMPVSGVFSVLSRITPSALAFALISIITALLFFSLLCGLCGAGCSTAEDMNGAMGVPMLLIMAGYIVSVAVIFFEDRPVVMASSLIPLLSAFCMPVQYALGRIGVGTAVISWAIQLIFVLLIAGLTARVYASLLILRGRRISLLQIMRSAFTEKGGIRS